MRFHRSPRHMQLLRDFIVVATLKKQFGDLLLPWA
jgi:hypothetical protein